MADCIMGSAMLSATFQITVWIFCISVIRTKRLNESERKELMSSTEIQRLDLI